MRINRFLAAAGFGSRRSCEGLIRDGSVTVNGHVCQNLATEVTDTDFVKVGGQRVQPDKHLYILLHKPRGYLCTASDTHDRRTIFELLPGQWPRLFHVGRLDRDSEGLLILTNDGDLALHLTHPRYKIEKEYEVLLDRPFDFSNDTARLLRGVSTEHGRARADSVRRIAPNLLRIVLRQGLKRQIRIMLYKVGYEVERLVRFRIGPLRLEDLRPGEWRALTAAEVKALREGPKTLQAAPAPPSAAAARPARPAKPSRPRSAPARRPAFTGKRSAASAPRGARRP
ncbi:MAG TPA: pseudouridine synthase [Chthoniobacteraceae bacterium]|nr:pseudouridine synthase [Chthoniobacteraceae bacterium]